MCLGIYLMAQVRETRAFRPLCRLAADGERIETFLGDGVTEDLWAILARTYDGDPAPLRSLIETEAADEYARDAALAALAWLTACGRIDRDEAARYLRDLHATLQPQGECYLWVGWQEAVARLGMVDLVPLVEDVFTRAWIDDGILGLADFHEDIRAAQQATNPSACFDDRAKDDLRLDDLVSYMSNWAGFQPTKERPKPATTARPSGWSPGDPYRGAGGSVTPAVRGAAVPVRNPYRDVGRNDPCPCGSGKKFKKCCLDTVR
jgi:uncharacterized protein